MDIQVILTQDDPKLGKRGDVVKVSSGFAQNFLFPHAKAKPATPANLKVTQDEKNRQAANASQVLGEAQALAEKIGKFSLSVEMAVGEGSKMFGAVTWKDIQQVLSGKAVSVEKRQILLEEPIKTLGEHSVTIKLHPQVNATLKLSVIKKK